MVNVKCPQILWTVLWGWAGDWLRQSMSDLPLCHLPRQWEHTNRHTERKLTKLPVERVWMVIPAACICREGEDPDAEIGSLTNQRFARPLNPRLLRRIKFLKPAGLTGGLTTQFPGEGQHSRSDSPNVASKAAVAECWIHALVNANRRNAAGALLQAACTKPSVTYKKRFEVPDRGFHVRVLDRGPFLLLHRHRLDWNRHLPIGAGFD